MDTVRLEALLTEGRGDVCGELVEAGFQLGDRGGGPDFGGGFLELVCAEEE